MTPLEGPSQRRLNVNIPVVEMERYSVMFEKLLKPQSSIMDRRQTMVKQLNLSDQPSGRVSKEGSEYTKDIYANNTCSLLPNLLLCSAALPLLTSVVAPLWLLR